MTLRDPSPFLHNRVVERIDEVVIVSCSHTQCTWPGVTVPAGPKGAQIVFSAFNQHLRERSA